MNTLCHYAIVRFMPFLETEEFANVGIILFSTHGSYAGYKLAPKRFARVTNFFDDLEGKLYTNAIAIFSEEMQRVTSIGSELYGKEQFAFFKEVTRKRESLLRFGEIRTIAVNSPQKALEELYEYYVGRNFVTKEYREDLMVKALRKDLNRNVSAIHYRQKVLTGEFDSEVTLPLVATVHDSYRAIKPIAFNQHKPMNLLEHGEKWIHRIKRLINADTVSPSQFLFAVEPPKSDDRALNSAYADIERKLNKLRVNVLPFAAKEHIYRFARAKMIAPEPDFTLKS
ncbi:DUF3037 domain-containing protein [Shewanella algae]|uniref:DUF3037 domain-containing protein n=1 Tax=Shewanella algae TaxID=38313 RepID=UPI00313B6638